MEINLEEKIAVLEIQLQNLMQEKNLLIAALDVLEDGIQIVDKNGRTILYTKGLEKIEQLKSENVLGKHISETYRLDEESSILLKVLKTGIPVKNRYTTYLTYHGKTASIITNTYPIFQYGKVVGAVSVNADITKVKELEEEILKLQRDLYFRQNRVKNGTQFCFDDIICTSKLMKNTIEIAKKFASNMSAVLIQGETGTGKELFAQSIHNYSPRCKGPFVAINCAAIPETLLEGILFGTSKGAFTGAEEKRGLFEEASEGTLFLDEINSMSMLLQTKLLRVLQSKTVRRVGGSRDIPVNPRIISAINIDPSEAIAKNQLRNDLYYRLAVVSLEVPPLRERLEDLPILINHFIKLNNEIMGKKIQGVNPQVLDVLQKYNWPGNVRELQHTIEYAMNLADIRDKSLTLDHLPHRIRGKLDKPQPQFFNYTGQNLTQTLLEIEREIIFQELKKNNGNITKTAQQLGISRQHLQYRLKRLNINAK